MTARIEFDMPFEAYRNEPGLSYSGMKRLSASPLDYWTHSALNPHRPEDEDAEHFAYGRAAHAWLLEGIEAFSQRFCAKIDPADFPGYLKTGEELAARCAELGLSKSGTLLERSERIRKADPEAKLWIDVEERHQRLHGGRTELSKTAIEHLSLAAAQIESSPEVLNLIRGGRPEVSVFWTDEATGVQCKARFDYLKGSSIVDLKTFNNSRGEPVHDAIARNVANYQYGLQAVMYCEGYRALWDAGLVSDKPTFTFIFLQSGQVPNVLVRYLRPAVFGERQAYWRRCEDEYLAHLESFRFLSEKFGAEPWIEPVMPIEFVDEDFPAYAL